MPTSLCDSELSVCGSTGTRKRFVLWQPLFTERFVSINGSLRRLLIVGAVS